MREILDFIKYIFFLCVTLAVLVIAIFLPLSCAESCIENAVWNEGIHQDCGGHWEYEQAIGHYFETNYIYCCDKCGAREEFLHIR